MMKQTVYLVLLLMIASMALFAQNHMDLAMSIFGDQDYDHFGDKTASLDFNGDGFDDLAVLQSWWVSDSIYVTIPYGESEGRNYGRILFYYGGPGFDGVADFTIEGSRPYQFHFSKLHMYRLGDVNGDGCEDLGIFEWSLQRLAPDRLDIFFGGANPSVIPGHVINMADPSIEQGHFYELGDINGDGYDDFGLWTYPNYSHTGYMSIILGGTFQQMIFDSISEADASGLHAIGDINNDGYDDFCYTIFRQRPTRFHIKLIYYGSSDLNQSLQFPYVIVPDYTESAAVVAQAVGDVNNDGYADFIGLMTGYGQRLWLGGSTISQDWDVLLNPPYGGLNDGHCTVSGDFNGDGYSDIIGADFILEEAALWLGGSNMNGTPDLFLYGISTGFHYGESMASGDFNADGYDDVAIGESSLSNDIFHGRIRIYTGNAQLEDTTVANDDPVLSGVGDQLSIRVSPNPVTSAHQSISISIQGTVPNANEAVSIEIFNNKGQSLYKASYQGLTSDEAIPLNMKSLSNGIYLCRVINGKYQATCRFSVVK